MASIESLDTQSPQQVAQELLQGTLAEWIVSNQPITINDTLKPYHTPCCFTPSTYHDSTASFSLHGPLS